MRPKGTLQGTVGSESAMGKPKLDNIVTTPKGNSTSVKQRVAALETSTSQVELTPSVFVSSLLLTPTQLAATYAQMARQVAATASSPAAQCEAILQDEWPDTDRDFGVRMVAKIGERPTDDVWMLHDTGSGVTVCPHGFQEEPGTKNDSGGSRCEAAMGNAVTL